MPRKAKIAPLPIYMDKSKPLDERLKEALRRYTPEGINKAQKEQLLYLERGYDETKNPLWAWDARSLARKWRLPVPEWVENYLDQAGEDLLIVENKVTKNSIAKCLELNGVWGNKTIFKHYQERRARDLAVDIMEMEYGMAMKVWEADKKKYRNRNQGLGPKPRLTEYAKEAAKKASASYKLKRALSDKVVIEHRDELQKMLKKK